LNDEELLEIAGHPQGVFNLTMVETAQQTGTFLTAVLAPVFDPPPTTTTTTSTTSTTTSTTSTTSTTTSTTTTTITTTTSAAPAFPTGPLDLSIIVDVSGSVGNANFNRMIAFITEILNDLDIGQDAVR
jgi:hypothetical protein